MFLHMYLQMCVRSSCSSVISTRMGEVVIGCLPATYFRE